MKRRPKHPSVVWEAECNAVDDAVYQLFMNLTVGHVDDAEKDLRNGRREIKWLVADKLQEAFEKGRRAPRDGE